MVWSHPVLSSVICTFPKYTLGQSLVESYAKSLHSLHFEIYTFPQKKKLITYNL